MTASADLLIRARRAAFNRAIAQGDATAIGPMLARDCIMITGTDSAVTAGRGALVRRWQQIFAARRSGSGDGVTYVRLPATITVSPIEPIALEQGAWQGREWTGSGGAEGALFASGVYSAKWRESGGLWAIEAEIFVTLA